MKYVAPEMKVVKFDAENVIVASAVVEETTTTTEPDIVPGEEW